MRVAHFHGGPLHGQTRTVDHTQICVPKPLALNYAALTDPDPIAPLVTGHYTPAPWSNDLDRWDWQGWDDEPRPTPEAAATAESIWQHENRHVTVRRTIPGPPQRTVDIAVSRDAILRSHLTPPQPAISDHMSPDAMRLDATTQAAQDEIAAWDAILHPQRATQVETGLTG